MGEGRGTFEVTGEVKVFPFILFLLSLLVIAGLLIRRAPSISILAVLAAGLTAFCVLVSVLWKRHVSRYLLLAYLVLIGGITLFYIAFGVDPFLKGVFSNILLALPALGAAMLMFYLGRFLKARALLAASIALSAALVLLSVLFFFKMNLRIRPQVSSMQEGHDSYLSSLRGADASGGPNVLLILTDDLGYGDVSVYGNRTISTPNIDCLAENGVVMDNFYAASPVCTPSRFAVLTGRYAARGHLDEVLAPTVKSFRPFNYTRHLNPITVGKGVDGILPDEITTAESLRSAGYETGMFGKWHLGDYGGYLPNEQGFDYFYGTYYSNDHIPYEFYRNEERVIEHPLDQTRITRVLTDEIIGYISEKKDSRFFIYYATPWPHDPVHASEEFQGTSPAGTYGDCMQEFDSGLGEILQALRDYDLFEDTLIIFTSDNGPWFEGSAGGLRGRKGNHFDGGHKVPFIASYPPVLPAGTRTASPAMNIDLFPTILELCGLPLPEDRVIDGVDIMPLLSGESDPHPGRALYYSRGGSVRGVQHGGFKYFHRMRSENLAYLHRVYKGLLLDLENDPDESYNVRELHPEVAVDLQERLMDFRGRLESNPRGIIHE